MANVDRHIDRHINPIIPSFGLVPAIRICRVQSVTTSVDHIVFLRLGVPCHHGVHMRSSVLDPEYLCGAKLWANANSASNKLARRDIFGFGDFEAISLLQRNAEKKKNMRTKP